VTVVVRHACASTIDAARLARAVAADNPPHVHVTAEGSALVIRVDPGSPGSVRATLDDLLACLAGAERTPAKASAPDAPRSE
jgi:hypothetical protein